MGAGRRYAYVARAARTRVVDLRTGRVVVVTKRDAAVL
jgi:hypothetical protein